MQSDTERGGFRMPIDGGQRNVQSAAIIRIAQHRAEWERPMSCLRGGGIVLEQQDDFAFRGAEHLPRALPSYPMNRVRMVTEIPVELVFDAQDLAMTA